MPLTFETLTRLLPDAVTLHEVTLDADAIALAQEAAGRVEPEGLTFYQFSHINRSQDKKGPLTTWFPSCPS
jgi:hypothetical protein